MEEEEGRHGAAAAAAQAQPPPTAAAAARPPRPPVGSPTQTTRAASPTPALSPRRADKIYSSSGGGSDMSGVSALSDLDDFPSPPPPPSGATKFAGNGLDDGANGQGQSILRKTSSAEDSASGPAPGHHQRGVSFDFNDNHNGATPITAESSPRDEEAAAVTRGRGPVSAPSPPSHSPIFQPDLSIISELPAGLKSPRQRQQKGGGGHVRRGTKISLADVVASPLEDEAEMAILKALETRDWEQSGEDDDAKYNKAMAKNAEKRTRNRTATSANSILKNVPDNALEMLAGEEAKAGGGGGIESKPSTDSHDTERSGGTASSRRRATRSSQRPAEAPKPTFKDVATRLRMMQGAKAAMGAGGGAGAEEGGSAAGDKRGKLQRQKTEYLKAAKKAEESRRNLGAQGGVKSAAASEAPAPALGKKKKSEHLIQPIENLMGRRESKPVSRGDALANDAAILFGETIGEESTDDTSSFADLEEQRPEPPRPVARNLSRLRKAASTAAALATLNAIKKQDDEGEDATQQHVDAHGVKVDGVGEDEHYENEDHYDDDCSHVHGGSKKSSGSEKSSGFSRLRRRSLFRYRAKRKAKSSVLAEVLLPKWPEVKMALATMMFFIILPMLLVASILFYAVGNPIAGCADKNDTSDCASYSWWVIFLGIRQVITLGLAKCTEVLLVEVIALRTKFFVRVLGPYITLLTVQARGWPFIIFFWAIWDFGMLYGNFDFSRHWLFWQRAIAMMNPENQAGTITYSNIYMRTLCTVIFFGGCVGLKRGWLAIYLGRNTVRHYGEQVEKLMRKMILISDVAHLAEEIRDTHFDDYYGVVMGKGGISPSPMNFDAIRQLTSDDDCDDDDSASERDAKDAAAAKKEKSDWQRLRGSSDGLTKGKSASTISALSRPDLSRPDLSRPDLSRPGLQKQSRAFINLSQTTRFKLDELVGEWEEPEIKAGSGQENEITVQEVLQFRQAVATLDHKYPFSVAFGSASTRETCIQSAQEVFEDLLLRTPDSGHTLPFETIALAALEPTGDLDEKKARRLLRMFRSDRDGNLTALDFVKSVDKTYKTLRTLRAAIRNSSQIDHAFEQLVNVFFYFILWMISLTILALDPWTLFLSLSGFLLGFSFLFGNAASKYFEGILLILVRRPYDIGDRVAISNPQNDTSPNGSSCWFVEGITLFTTTVRYGSTNEVATYSNGSLANMRIINAMRSPKATVYIYLKFGSEVPYERVMVFKSVVESFVKDRPRQWLSMSAFRSTRVEADLGYIEYVLVLVHVEKWQNLGAILTSKAEASSYCLEVQKKLGMHYSAPPLPVNLELVRNDVSRFEANEVGGSSADPTNVLDLGALGSLFAPIEAKKTR